jgi:hypothetical protein
MDADYGIGLKQWLLKSSTRAVVALGVAFQTALVVVLSAEKDARLTYHASREVHPDRRFIDDLTGGSQMEGAPNQRRWQKSAGRAIRGG